MARKKTRLGEMLVAAGMIDDFQLHSALSHQRNCGGGRLGSSLIRLKYISEEKLLAFLSEQLDIPRIDLARRVIPPNLLALIPAETAWKYRAVPVDHKVVNGVPYLLVVMAEPTDAAAIEALQKASRSRVRPALAFESAIIGALVNLYGPPLSSEDPLRSGPGATESLPTPESGEPSKGTVPLEEKYLRLLKTLHDKGILSLGELERLK